MSGIDNLLFAKGKYVEGAVKHFMPNQRCLRQIFASGLNVFPVLPRSCTSAPILA